MTLLTSFRWDAETISIFIPIIAIVTVGVVVVVKAVLRHQERIAMIERGMHPDRDGDESVG